MQKSKNVNTYYECIDTIKKLCWHVNNKSWHFIQKKSDWVDVLNSNINVLKNCVDILKSYVDVLKMTSKEEQKVRRHTKQLSWLIYEVKLLC